MLPVAFLALAVVACSSGPGGNGIGSGAGRPTPIPTPGPLKVLPASFPRSFVDKRTQALPLLTPVAGGMRAHWEGTLSADDGTTGTYKASYIENRVAIAQIKCGAGTYLKVFTAADPKVTTEVDFAKWGHMQLVATKRVVVYSSALAGSSPAVCDQQVGGTYLMTFSKGPTLGFKAGTWHIAPDGRLVLDDPPPAPTAAPTPTLKPKS